jgi:hypothetical protein
MLGKLLEVGRDLLGFGVRVQLLQKDLALLKDGLHVGLVLDIEEGSALVNESLGISIDLLRGHIVGLANSLGHEPRDIVGELVQFRVDCSLCPHILDIANEWVQTVALSPALEDHLKLKNRCLHVGILTE